MAKKKNSSKKLFRSKNPRKTLGMLFVFVALLGAFYFLKISNYKADSTSAASNNCKRGIVQNVKKNMGTDSESCPARGSRLTAEVEKPFANSNLSAYPNGKDCANVNIEAIRSDGTFLENEPLVIEKPSSVSISGPQNTESGSIKLCFISSRPIQARITIKIKSLPTVQRSFQLNFNPSFSVLDATDRNSFFYNLPVTFMAQIDPSLVNSLKEQKLIYTYNRRVNKWGRWRAERREIATLLTCTDDGRCTATIYPDNTNTKRVDRGKFNYKFEFVDNTGRKLSKSFTGQLRLP
ncbi:MAG: hypothetical protein M1324_01060 [Patescibacteria group bacterium]|nr:hypothetical protein [Patescibacteria group bacterium]